MQQVAVQPGTSTAAGRSGRGVLVALLLPALAFLLVTFIMPLLWLLRMSFAGDAFQSSLSGVFVPSNFTAVLFEPYYWRVAGRTILLGVTVAIIAVIMAYPIALFLHRTTSRWKGVLVALAIAPLLTSTMVRTYGWMVILNDQGVINGALRALGVITRPLAIFNNFTGVVIALVEILMPYAILAMLSGLGRLDVDFEDAASLLGANRWRVFRRIVLPLSLPGIMTGALLVFVLAISSFVTPRLVGGGHVAVLGTEVFDEATVTLNWPLAAALSILLLVLFGGVTVAYQRLLSRVER